MLAMCMPQPKERKRKRKKHKLFGSLFSLEDLRAGIKDEQGPCINDIYNMGMFFPGPTFQITVSLLYV